jgi:Ca-activated chloride channel family protein
MLRASLFSEVPLMKSRVVLTLVALVVSSSVGCSGPSPSDLFVNSPSVSGLLSPMSAQRSLSPNDGAPGSANTESYQTIHENPFLAPLKNPLSTFSIDVDTASYSNVRRFLNQGKLPPKDAVRIEEMLNYFRYDYAQPEAGKPFALKTELSEAPWKKGHQLLQIGLQAPAVEMGNTPRSNLVFLLDTSGSMASPDKLPLLKQSLRLMVDQLSEKDSVSMVVYAGSAGQVLPPTPGHRKDVILKALDNLEAGGGTAGGAGIRLAYSLARQQFIQGGNNRVILATDGDFNVGASSDAEMEYLIEQERKEGVFLTVLGFGTGNYKDSKMETLANKGNGNYAYIDSLSEARKVVVQELGATLLTVAKDVKLQVEFNPAKVAKYRLIGYENRLLRAEDFDNDAKDAGELGAGHTVTALYEIEPVTAATAQEQSLTYTETEIKDTAFASDDLLTLKLRYKQPHQDTSELLTHTVEAQAKPWSEASVNLQFAASVAGFGMLLRQSEHKGDLTLSQVKALGQAGKGPDKEGYRQAYLELLTQAEGLGLK